MTIQRLETVYGPMFVPDTDTGQYGWLKLTATSPEHDQIELICKMLDEREPGYAVDVGANFGCWTLPLARHSKGVFAFEPQPPVFSCLYRTVSAAEVETARKIVLSTSALGEYTGEIDVPVLDLEQPANFGGVSLGIAHSEQPKAMVTKVPISPLDDRMPAFFMFRPGNISFIKVDVEGAELSVIRGARRTIERCKPILLVEADHPRTNRFVLGNFIESLGYNVEVIRGNNFLGMPV